MGSEGEDRPTGIMKRLLRAYAARSGRNPTEIERIAREARESDLLHGRTARIILGAAEGEKWAIWIGRATTVLIVGGIYILIAGSLGWPNSALVVPFGFCVLVAVVCFALALSRLFRWYGILLFGPRDDRPSDEARGGAALPEDNADVDGGTGRASAPG